MPKPPTNTPFASTSGQTVAPPGGQPVIASVPLPTPSPCPAGQPTGGTA